jgi:hypothetical protein
MRKIIFTVPFYHACRAQPLRLLGYYTARLQSRLGNPYVTYIFPHYMHLCLHLLPYG